MYRAILSVGMQPQLLEFIQDLDYSADPVVLVPTAAAEAIVDSLGWPREPGLHVLACRLLPNMNSSIHKDRNADGSVGLCWALNVPIKDTWGTWMEWFEPTSDQADCYYNIPNPVDGTPVPALKHAHARSISRSMICTETAYVARNDQWHKIVNMTDRTSWCVSIRYYPLGYEPWDRAQARTPWLANIAKTGKP